MTTKTMYLILDRIYSYNMLSHDLLLVQSVNEDLSFLSRPRRLCSRGLYDIRSLFGNRIHTVANGATKKVSGMKLA